MGRILEVTILLLAALTAVSAQDNCPDIISRLAWGSRTTSADVPVLPIRPAPFVIIHHTQTEVCTNIVNCSPIIRDIQSFHMAGNGWRDISYHFLMAADYRLYEGRGWGRRGENVGGFTNQAINVGLIGTFQVDPPTDDVLEVLDNLIACGISQGALASNVAVIAQCQVTSIVSCEGSTIFDWVSQHPRFIANPRAA